AVWILSGTTWQLCGANEGSSEQYRQALGKSRIAIELRPLLISG
ncbi:MAG: hypothetical protein ACI823_002528, partial [Chitinophagales bacterium]